jgi:hypothetical protein
MAKKRIKGINIETSKINRAAQGPWWRSAAAQGIEFAYLRFFNGISAPDFRETSMLRGIGYLDRDQIALGAYCILDPYQDGEHQARLFIDYMSELRWRPPFGQTTFAEMYKIRPALWLDQVGDPSSIRNNAALWLDTVSRFMCEPVAGREPLYHDKPIVAASYKYAELMALPSSLELSKYHLWIFDDSAGAYPAQDQSPAVPRGFKADLWQTKPILNFNGQDVGFNLSIDLGKKDAEPKKGFPIRRVSALPLIILGGLAFGPAIYRKITKTEKKTTPQYPNYGYQMFE